MANAYAIERAAALGLGNYEYAVAAIRQSIDISPPATVKDSRFSTLFDSALNIVRDDNCKATPSNMFFDMLTFYLASQLEKNLVCILSFQENLFLESSSTETSAYILLRQAFSDAKQGNLDRAAHWLDEATTFGLSPIWQEVLFSRSAGMELTETAVVPTYQLFDETVAGYEIDPLQVELGLPLDLVVFYNGATANEYTATLLQLINLAPNPGFEYPQEQLCPLADCMPLGFETDLYNGNTAPSVYEFPTVNRPWTTAKGAGFIHTKSLMLNNRNLSTKQESQSTSLISFVRNLDPNRRYLYGGWIKAADGNGYIGYCWRCEEEYISYRYIVEQYQIDQWFYANQIIIVPVDPGQSRIWLLNFNSPGDVLFDNLLLVELP